MPSDHFNDLLAEFPLPPPAASRRTAAILGAETIIHLAAQFILRLFVAGDSSDFSAEDVRRNVPEFREAYAKANIIGTFLGRGVHGKGLGLARGARGRLLVSYDNACRVVHHLEQAEINHVADAVGMSVDELAAAIEALPRSEK